MNGSKNIWRLLIQSSREEPSSPACGEPHERHISFVRGGAVKKHAAGAALAAGLLVMTQAVFTVLEVIVLQHFLEGFSTAFFQLGQSLFYIAALAAMYAFRYFRMPLLNWLNGSIALRLRESLDRLIIRKVQRISLVSLEHAEHQALLGRVQDAPEKRYTNGLYAILEIGGGVMQTVGVLFLLAGSVPYFFAVILLLLGLMVIVFRIIGRNRVKLYHARQEIGRRGDYLSGILFDRRLAQEKKLFGYTPYIQKIYEEENIQSNRKLLGRIFASNLILWFYDNITFLFSASAYLIFLIPLSRGEINIGLYIAIIPALTRLGAFFVAVGSEYLPTYQEYRACLKDITALEELEEQFYIPVRKKNSNSESSQAGQRPWTFHEIRGENIVFRYSGSDKPVLNGLNFTFRAGKNYALVGENGCGKSTFVKLLMGFYKPESGKITIDGKDIQEMEFSELQSCYSAVFQDFNRYDYTIRENIVMSALGGAAQTQMERAAEEAGLGEWISSFPDAYDTTLGSLTEGGANLSGGQWQRLAIARMLYREAGVYLWDEPTAAMDPLAESKLYSAFLKKRSDNLTNIFITHRLGACISADEICVLADGHFVEQGSHAQLMQMKDGIYKSMFEAQKGMYE